MSPLYAAGNRVVFLINDAQIWSSDGTADGTVDLTETIFAAEDVPPSITDRLGITEAGDEVMIPDSQDGSIWSTDGTIAGTIAHELPTSGNIGFSAVAGDKYYFTVTDDSQTPAQLTLYALDLSAGGQAVAIYQPPGEASDIRLSWTYATGGAGAPAETGTSGRLFFVNEDLNTFVTKLVVHRWHTAPPSTTELASFPDLGIIMDRVFIGDTAYFAVAVGGDDPTREASETGACIGWIGAREGDKINTVIQRNTNDPFAFELWKSDGTVAGTEKIKTLWTGEAGGKRILATLSAADGELLVRTEVATGITFSNAPEQDAGLTTVSDETVGYDPLELNPQRQGATARLVNGILHLNGSTGDDQLFRRWRSQCGSLWNTMATPGASRSARSAASSPTWATATMTLRFSKATGDKSACAPAFWAATVATPSSPAQVTIPSSAATDRMLYAPAETATSSSAARGATASTAAQAMIRLPAVQA